MTFLWSAPPPELRTGLFALSLGFFSALVGTPTTIAQERTLEQGMAFRTVRAAGNISYPGGELFANAGVGTVGYDFRIGETEVTVGQWLEFVRAFSPHWTGPPEANGLVGNWIRYDGAPGQYHAVPGSENLPADMSWRMAARFCNWIQNDRRNEASAFQRGVYDVSTFGGDRVYPFTDQLSHDTGARFWIPTQDEWFKAAYYDPNRFGTALGGYWLYPNGTNDTPVYALPSQGGQSNGGLAPLGPFFGQVPVGSYPDTRSPWGLLDVSGGRSEWLETADPSRQSRLGYGSWFADIIPEFNDRADFNHRSGSVEDDVSHFGLRVVAAVVPSPSGVALVVGATLLITFHRRRTP